MTTGSHWGDKQVELLTTLWKSGMPAREIALRMSYNGYRYTKNSVLGKVFRLGLSRNGERNKKIEQAPKRPRRIRKKVLAAKRTKATAPSPPPIEPEHKRPYRRNGIRAMPPRPSRQVFLTQTRDEHCRAIVGYLDGEKAKAVCCGEETIWLNHNGRNTRSSWCQHHFALYTAEPRKRYD